MRACVSILPFYGKGDLHSPSILFTRSLDEFIRSRQGRRHSKKLQMQGAQILRNEAYREVRPSDER